MKIRLTVQSYKNLMRWALQIGQRPAVQRGRAVNKLSGDPETQVPERHSEADFHGKRLD